METLFPEHPHYPSGFEYFPDFISLQEEKDLLGLIGTIELHPFLFQGYIANRKVASFGYDYSFEQRQLKEGTPIPSAFAPRVRKVASHNAVQHARFV